MFEALWERRAEEEELVGVLTERVHPGSWSDSRVEILEARWAEVGALLARHPDPTRDGWSVEQRARIADRCGRESERDRRTDERFE